ncbi:hypothetical protein [Desulfatibacillum aliphaticivorans]|uniref:hypothetical protein n=1 Tax=Desulfatibacillum aliphaticivorans TaxID=218208 RepID=UPI0012FBE176|nr:hypothetical protein [Desulfatibacillum aliphaticivorans]
MDAAPRRNYAALASIGFLIFCYFLFWIADLASLQGMTDKDIEPIPLIVLPITAVIYSTIDFIIFIFLPAVLIRRIAAAVSLSNTWVWLLTICVSAFCGAVFGAVCGIGNYSGMLLYCIYMAGGAAVYSTLCQKKRPPSNADTEKMNNPK